ncbi:MAG: hypothetical protein ACR2QS_13015 [Woeseiaceae bacterium]
MNKTLTLMLTLIVMTSACAPTPRVAVIPNCSAGPVASACPPGLADRDKIKIHVTPANVVITPPMVCTERGGTVTATITKAGSVPNDVVVAMIPKNATNGWILSSRKGPGTMPIAVPAATEIRDDYGYFVMTSTGQCVDPIIHVDK